MTHAIAIEERFSVSFHVQNGYIHRAIYRFETAVSNTCKAQLLDVIRITKVQRHNLTNVYNLLD